MDYNISYIDINSLKLVKYLDTETVLEVKASDKISFDYIQEFIYHPTSRFSKYASGKRDNKRGTGDRDMRISKKFFKSALKQVLKDPEYADYLGL